MPIESLVVMGVGFLILFFSHLKKDYASLLFACILFVNGGLITINTAPLGEYSYEFGLTIIFFGIYIGMRAGIDLIVSSLKGGVTWQKKNKQRNQK